MLLGQLKYLGAMLRQVVMTHVCNPGVTFIFLAADWLLLKTVYVNFCSAAKTVTTLYIK